MAATGSSEIQKHNESTTMKRVSQHAEIQGEKTRPVGMREVSQAKAQGVSSCRVSMIDEAVVLTRLSVIKNDHVRCACDRKKPACRMTPRCRLQPPTVNPT
jgi:hypothetical protein